MFKNATMYLLPPDFRITGAELEEKLSKLTLQPCPALAFSTQGFVPPAAGEGLVFSQEKYLLFALGTETKILPSAVVRQAAARDAEEFEKRTGFKPGRKAMKDLTAAAVDRLLPAALTKRSTTMAYMDLQRMLLVVNTPSRSAADLVCSGLRAALESCPVIKFHSANRPGPVMQDWLSKTIIPMNLAIGGSCVLTKGSGEKVRYSNIDVLDSAEVRAQVGHGMSVESLAVASISGLEFTLTDSLVLRSLRFPTTDDRDSDGQAGDGLAADFALLVAEIAYAVAAINLNFGAGAWDIEGAGTNTGQRPVHAEERDPTDVSDEEERTEAQVA